MCDRFVLAIDCGTQSIRALLFDEKGNLTEKGKVEFEPYFSNNPGWAEQDANLYWDSLCRACNILREKKPKEFEKIIGITLTTMRDTVVNVDENGNALRPAILWLDQRMAKCEKPMAFYENLAFSAIGMRSAVEISRRKGKANWIIENQRDIWEKTYKYLMISGYLTFKLTGKMIDSVGCQIGHIPFDYKNLSWPKSPLSYRWHMFGVDINRLPDIVNPGEILGYVTREASVLTGIKEGTVMIASASDKGCETLGCGCIDTESACISFGTTATVQTTSDKYIEPISFMPSYPAAIPNKFNPEIQVYRGYWMISWFKKEFAAREMIEAKEKGVSPESLLNERLNEIPPGSQGLVLQPYWSPGLKMPKAKGAMIGFGDVHTRAHIYRAIIEGINYALLDGIEKIEKKSGSKIKQIMVCGGGSQSDAICQITADMMGRPVLKGQTYEMSGLGAAINGFVGLKIYKNYDEAVKNMVHYGKIFEPDENNMKIYKELYNRVYKKIYPKLKEIYDEIQKITMYPEIW
ncbi:Sugar (pentulose or hexulose) kinase [Caloramator quimbayensis]|uniref:Sugar (Pentulose or hexulose) kinase n=1 Tax=Caloramator quimbayensis TaxID=1147123 RepID=A0A1T4YGM4_9CLOT|nr:FGGY-family carbohydrate kinase [Caloramator quimbayensis]SKB00800.1 Sugar (pentulose or hexulose) kinase [Caloramator quimbayensis]